MNRIEELQKEIVKCEDIVRNENIKIQKAKSELLALTKQETEQYYHKYIKYYPANCPSYVRYLYVEACESDYEGSWILNGHGFITYINEDSSIKFETISLSCGGLHLSNIENGYDVVEFVTVEEFYDVREKTLRQLIDERYS